MLASQRSRLLTRGQAVLEALHPAQITFPGKAPIDVARRTGAVLAELEEGFEGSEPQMFFILRSKIPSGVAIAPKTTRFTCDGCTWKVISINDEPSDPHVRIVANIPSVKARG